MAREPYGVRGGRGITAFSSRQSAGRSGRNIAGVSNPVGTAIRGGQGMTGYTGGPYGTYAGRSRRGVAGPYVRPMPPPTGTEAVVRPGVPGGRVRVISNVVRERPSPVPRARPASAPAKPGPLTPSQREARRQQERGSSVAGPTGRSTGRIGTRTGGVAPGTGGRMTRSQRDEPAGPRGGGGGGRVGTRTGGVAAGTGGRQTQSQRNAPAGPRGTRM